MVQGMFQSVGLGSRTPSSILRSGNQIQTDRALCLELTIMYPQYI